MTGRQDGNQCTGAETHNPRRGSVRPRVTRRSSFYRKKPHSRVIRKGGQGGCHRRFRKFQWWLQRGNSMPLKIILKGRNQLVPIQVIITRGWQLLGRIFLSLKITLKITIHLYLQLVPGTLELVNLRFLILLFLLDFWLYFPARGIWFYPGLSIQSSMFRLVVVLLHQAPSVEKRSFLDEG